MILSAVLVALLTLVAGVLAAFLAHRLRRLSLQLMVFGLVAVALPLGAVLATGAVMFDSGHDLVVLAIACAAGLAALVGAWLLSRSIVKRLERLGRASSAMAAGDLSARAPVGGPDELDRVAADFNQMAARLEELFDARRQLVAWASHDLRTPVASLRAMIEAVEDGVVPADRYLPVMSEQITALGRMIDDLFELARIDAGALDLEVDETSLAEVVSSCVRGVEAEAERRSVTVEAIVDPSWKVRSSPESVERVLYNLLRNSLRHTPADGAISVVVANGDAEVQVAVEDTGAGFPSGAEDTAFERFWRGDSARSDGGAGLGLAIAKGLIEAQGGRIWAEGRPEGGARVCFTLPAA